MEEKRQLPWVANTWLGGLLTPACGVQPSRYGYVEGSDVKLDCSGSSRTIPIANIGDSTSRAQRLIDVYALAGSDGAVKAYQVKYNFRLRTGEACTAGSALFDASDPTKAALFYMPGSLRDGDSLR